MKRNIIELEGIKQKINALKGFPITMEVNRGRNKIIKYEGKIVNVFQSVFIVETNNQKAFINKTFSYFDVLCGDVKIVQEGK